MHSYLILSSGSFTAQVLYGVLPWAIAILLLKRYGPQTLVQGEPSIPLATTPPSAS